MSDYRIEVMQRDEVDLMVDWAANEGWNPGLHDAANYYAADPNGFLIGKLNGKPIATISAVKYGQSFGFIGFYIVHPDYRGRGYGIQIWNAALHHLEGRNVGLDGVVDQQNNYKKSGFQLAYRNIRMEGTGGGECPSCSELVDLTTLPFEKIQAYELPYFPEKREAFLRSWIRQPDSVALGYVEKGNLLGYGVLRPCRTGYKLAPLFADSAEVAGIIFRALKSRIGQTTPLYLDTPEVNPEALALAESAGMKYVFETARMYNQVAPDLPVPRIFGITSFEVG